MQFVMDVKATPKKRERARRLEQIARWMQCHFPAPCPIAVQYVDQIMSCEQHGIFDHDTLGTCILDEDKKGGPRLVIAVADQKDLVLLVDTLMHEWAHAVTMAFTGYQKSMHCDEYWISHGRIYRAFYEEGGLEASRGL